MQSFTQIPKSHTLNASLDELLNNDKTIMSNSSGTAFPTANIQVGMLCLRTDQLKLYELTARSPDVWKLIFDLALTATSKEYVDWVGGQKADKTYVDSQDAQKANIANPALTGVPTAPTAIAGTNTNQLATTSFVQAATSPYAPLANPSLSGTPSAPTPAYGANTNQLATTAFVQTAIAAKEPANATILKQANIGSTVQGFDAKTVKSESGITNIWVGSQAAYNALSKVSTTLYFIQE